MSFIIEENRPVHVSFIRDSDVNKVRKWSEEWLTGHPGVEILQINNECLAMGNKMFHCCWIYSRLSGESDEEVKRI